MSDHKKPWQVRYRRVYDGWFPKAMPYIVDSEGGLVVELPYTVDHPGMYDELADNTAKEIVASVNASYGAFGL